MPLISHTNQTDNSNWVPPTMEKKEMAEVILVSKNPQPVLLKIRAWSLCVVCGLTSCKWQCEGGSSLGTEQLQAHLKSIRKTQSVQKNHVQFSSVGMTTGNYTIHTWLEMTQYEESWSMHWSHQKLCNSMKSHAKPVISWNIPYSSYVCTIAESW